MTAGLSGNDVVNLQGEVIGIESIQLIEGKNINFVIPDERIVKLTPSEGKRLVLLCRGIIFNRDFFLLIKDVERALFYLERAVQRKFTNEDMGTQKKPIASLSLKLCFQRRAAMLC